jgi:hypothetical protein
MNHDFLMTLLQIWCDGSQDSIILKIRRGEILRILILMNFVDGVRRVLRMKNSQDYCMSNLKKLDSYES